MTKIQVKVIKVAGGYGILADLNRICRDIIVFLFLSENFCIIVSFFLCCRMPQQYKLRRYEWITMSKRDSDKKVRDTRRQLRRVGKAVRSERHRQRKTLAEIAEKASLTPSLLSQIELGKTIPSLMSLRLISRALNVSVVSLLSYLEGDSRLVKSNNRPSFKKKGYPAQFEMAAPDLSGYIEPVIMKLKPGMPSSDDLATHRCDEWAMVLKGQVSVELNGTPYDLEEGDSLYIDASGTPHRYVNCSDNTSEVLLVMSPPAR